MSTSEAAFKERMLDELMKQSDACGFAGPMAIGEKLVRAPGLDESLVSFRTEIRTTARV